MNAFAGVKSNDDRPRGTRIALWVIVILFALTCLAGFAALFFHFHGVTFSRIFGAVFVMFGIFKIVLSYDAYTAPTAEAPRSSQRQESGKLFTLWMFYKLWAGFLALFVGLYLIIVGIPYVDHMASGVYLLGPPQPAPPK